MINIDIHTHILFGLDDGPEFIESSIAMAKKFVESGTHRLFATPHGYSPYFHAESDAIRTTLLAFQDHLQQSDIRLECQIGMEVRYHHSLIEHMLSGSALCLGGKMSGPRFLLLELPTREWPKQLPDMIYELLIRDITPIIAHPERNLIAQQQPRIVEESVQEGAWLQLTAGAITGAFGALCQKTAKRFATEGFAHLIASDAHDPINRAPGLTSAYQTIANDWRLPDVAANYQQNAETIWKVSSE